MAGEYYSSKRAETGGKKPLNVLPQYPVTKPYNVADFPKVEDLTKQVAVDELNQGVYGGALRDKLYTPLYEQVQNLTSNLSNLPQVTLPDYRQRPENNIPEFNSFIKTLQDVDPNFRNPGFNQADYVGGYDPEILKRWAELEK